MRSSDEIKSKIIQLVTDRYQYPGPFEEFAAQLSELGVIRQTYDVIKNEILFYSKDTLILPMEMSDVEKHQTDFSCSIGTTLNESTLKKAISDFDAGEMSPAEFHRHVALSGIVYVSVYFKQRKIYYLSQEAKYYLEQY